MGRCIDTWTERWLFGEWVDNTWIDILCLKTEALSLTRNVDCWPVRKFPLRKGDIQMDSKVSTKPPALSLHSAARTV